MPEDNRARLKQWLESGEARLHPLTLPQRELWEASPVPAGAVANHICNFIQVRGSLSFDDGVAALQRVVDRHEALRTSFLPGKAGPVQLVRSTGTAVMENRELPTSQYGEEAVEEAMREFFLQPFDLLRGPLFRAAWFQRTDDEFLLVFAGHHSIADGWSLGVFVQDLVSAYIMNRKGGAALPAVPESYSAWGAAERALWTPQLLAERAGFWKKTLAGSSQLWTSPNAIDLARPLARRITHIDAPLTAAIRNLARNSGATLFSTLLTAFQWTLWRWTGRDDITVGTPVANRNRKTSHETMGYYAGNVPLRGHVARDKPFADALRDGHAANTDAFAHYMPFAELVKAVGDQQAAVHHPVYSVRFALQNHPVPDVTLPSLTMKLRMRSTGTARFDLACEVTEEGDRLEVVWLHRPGMFSDGDIDTLNELFLTVSALVCDDSTSRPTSIPF